MLTLSARSKRTSSPTEMRPEPASMSPATQSSSIVFPAPDPPNRIVNPGATRKLTSRVNPWVGVDRLACTRTASSTGIREPSSAEAFLSEEMAGASLIGLFYRADGPSPAIESINNREQPKTEDEQQQGRLIRAAVVRNLHPIIDIDRDRARHTRYIATNHEHHAELSHGVGKTQHRTGNQSRQ